MNTTELYIEPVFIGFMVLLVVALPFSPELAGIAMAPKSLDLPEGLAIGAALVGLAYLIGICADRLLDSCLAVLEKHARLRFACKAFKGKWNVRKWDDPYSEDEYRTLIFLKGEDAATWIQYIRSRVRLMRGVVFMLPGITYAAVVAAVRSNVDGVATSLGPWKDIFSLRAKGILDLPPLEVVCTYSGILIGYTAMGVLAFVLPRLDPLRALSEAWEYKNLQDGPHQDPDLEKLRRLCRPRCLAPAIDRSLRQVGRWSPPRTNEEKAMRLYAIARRITAEEEVGQRYASARRATMEKVRSSPVPSRSLPNLDPAYQRKELEKAQKQRKWRLRFDVALQPFPIGAALLILVAITTGVLAPNSGIPVSIAIAGGVLTWLAGWAWWRTTFTFMTYVQLMGAKLQAQ